MSFMLTVDQVRNGTKTVTRRLGWKFLKPGDRLMACVKCQGLGPGGKIEKIREIEAVSVRREPLTRIFEEVRPGLSCIGPDLEGFPDLTNQEFVEMFMNHMGCEPETLVTRIEFKYVEVPS